MKNLWKDRNSLFCFTPEVMLATFVIEIALAVYVFVRYRMSAFGRLTAMILILLAGFQAVEYQICTGVNTILWSRIGFIIITFLPVLGLHLIYLVTGKNHFLKLGYALMAAFIFVYAFAENAIAGPAVCAGNYIIFQSASAIGLLYAGYYFLFLFLGIWEAAEGMRNNKEHRLLLEWLIAGYLAFIVPMGIVYVFSPMARSAIPSIMCGFALLFALILALRTVPLYYENNRQLTTDH